MGLVERKENKGEGRKKWRKKEERMERKKEGRKERLVRQTDSINGPRAHSLPLWFSLLAGSSLKSSDDRDEIFLCPNLSFPRGLLLHLLQLTSYLWNICHKSSNFNIACCFSVLRTPKDFGELKGSQPQRHL